MTPSNATTALTPRADLSTTDRMSTKFSYLDIAGLIVEDWLLAHPEDGRTAEAVADAILGSFSAERLRTLVLAHLLA